MATVAVAYAPSSQAISDADRDALHVLPLSMLPLQTPPLARARMIKNANLESVVELFADATTGSGQIDVDALPSEFGWSSTVPHPDLIMLRKLALLPSFDVYSLRILLRGLGIPVNDESALCLSADCNAALTRYMTVFTRPLIMRVYGGDNTSVKRFEDLVQLFRDPDQSKALSRLKMLAANLNVRVTMVPQFLEDYGDVYLSLCYYRDALNRLTPILDSFRVSLAQIRSHQVLSKDRQIVDACQSVQAVLTSGLNSVRWRLDHFEQRTADMWEDISAEKFRELRTLITGSQTTIGGILCALTVKMAAWSAQFPANEAGALLRRADFMVNQMRRGIEKIQHLEAHAPPLPERDTQSARRQPAGSA